MGQDSLHFSLRIWGDNCILMVSVSSLSTHIWLHPCQSTTSMLQMLPAIYLLVDKLLDVYQRVDHILNHKASFFLFHTFLAVVI